MNENNIVQWIDITYESNVSTNKVIFFYFCLCQNVKTILKILAVIYQKISVFSFKENLMNEAEK